MIILFIMEVKKSLEILGLSERESRVYYSLLKIGQTTSTAVVKETGISSSKIYDILERLEQKGLVSYILIKGKKNFLPSSPRKLFNLIKEKEELIEEILPFLQTLYEDKSEEIQAEIYKGKEGMKSIFEDILVTKKDWINLGSSGKSEDVLPYYMDNFYKKMQKNNIKLCVLAVNTNLTREKFRKLKENKNISIF